MYNVFEGNQSPAIELIHKESTDKPNGTTVKVPVKQSDIKEFEKKTLPQLYYFENIVFIGFSDRFVTNNYQIFKGKNFLYRGNDYHNNIHVCYGKVAYPLDFEATGLNPYDYKLPIALRIEIGELEGTGVTPSRELLKYTKNNIRIIRQKLDAAIEELKGMLAKQLEDVVSLEDYYKVYSNVTNLAMPNGDIISLSNVISKNNISFPNFRYNDLHIPSPDFILENFYQVKLYGKKYPKRRSTSHKKWDGSLLTINTQPNLYYVDGEFKRNILKQSYIKTLHGSENFYIITPTDLKIERKVLERFGVIKPKIDFDILNGNDEEQYEYIVPRKKALSLIKKLRGELEKFIHTHCINYDEVEVTKEFIESRKKKRMSKELLTTTIPVKEYAWSVNIGRVKLETFQNFKGKIYYGFQDDDYMLENARRIFENTTHSDTKLASAIGYRPYRGKVYNHRGTMIIRISRGNEKYMKMLGNKAIHVNNFYKTYVSRKIDQIVQSKVLNKIRGQFREVNDIIKDDILQYVDKDVYDTVRTIQHELNTISSEYSNNVHTERIKSDLGIDLDKEESKYQKKVDQVNHLIRLTEKNINRLKWFILPYEVNPDKDSHKELINMLKLVFEK